MTGKQGFYQQFNVQKKPMTVKEFYHKASSDRYATPKYFDYEDLERKFWKNVTYIQPIYGNHNYHHINTHILIIYSCRC